MPNHIQRSKTLGQLEGAMMDGIDGTLKFPSSSRPARAPIQYCFAGRENCIPDPEQTPIEQVTNEHI